MLNSNRINFARHTYLFGLFLLAASLPFSKFLMSLSEMILLISWLAGGNTIEKLKIFLKNKAALIISSIFILHLIGLIYTFDFTYGLEDVKKKIPLLLLPLIFSTSVPLSKNILEKLLSVFVLSVIVATLICFYVLLGYSSREILQPQQASIFMSHIRFGLLISLSIFILGYFFTTKDFLSLKIIIPVLISWLILFLILIESATGLICTVSVSIILFFWYIIKMKRISLKISLLAVFILGCFFLVRLFSSVTDFNKETAIDKNNLPLLTINGHHYTNDTLNREVENGNYVWQRICEKELADEWNKKSRMDYGGKDLQGNEIKYTLTRFLTSKGLSKDSVGIHSLSEEEIKGIEKGIPNVNYIRVFNPTARMQKIIWEFNTYLHGGNPSGHSVIQRLEFWKTAIGIIKENFLFGVGTGDVDKAFEMQYEKMNSPLTKEWRLRSHNQFLAIGTAFGIIGLIWFLISLVYPLLAEKKYKDYFYLTFFIIAFLSMLTEDTLESQAGVTFFAFFNSLFLFCPIPSNRDADSVLHRSREKTEVHTES